MIRFIVIVAICFIAAINAEGQQILSHKSQPITIGASYKIFSESLNEDRIINIYFPAEYASQDTVTYPVIFLLDGSLDEDFHHVSGLVQFNTFPWVQRMPPAIVVGIATVNRLRDFTFPSTIKADQERFPTAGGSASFTRFLKEELHPFVKSNFRTRRDFTLVGQSLGGLIATHLLFQQPDLFDRYLIVSPSLWWDGGSLLETDLTGLKNQLGHKKVFIAVGKEGLTPGEHPRVMEVDANLLADKLRSVGEVVVHFDYLPEENHATIMHQAVMNGFNWLFGQQEED